MSSFVWKYFIKINKNSSKCKICDKNLRSCGNTSNLMKHLNCCHHALILEQSSSRTVTDLKQEPTSSKKKKKLKIEQTKLLPENKSSTPLSRQDLVPVQESMPLQSQFQSQSTIEIINPKIRSTFEGHCAINESNPRHEHDEITNSLIYYICVDSKPFHTVASKGFLKLMKTIAPHYTVPSYSHIKNLVSDKYDDLKNALIANLKNVDWFCVTCLTRKETMWTSSYLGVTLHYLEGTELKCAYIATLSLHEGHTAEYISIKLTEAFNDWNIETTKIKAILTNNAANMAAAVANFIESDFSKNISCFVDTINQIADETLQENSLTKLIDTVREIVKYFKKSVWLSDKYPAPKRLILDVKSKWISRFYMIERFIELAPMISAFLLQNNDAPAMPSDIELHHLKELLSLLKPLEFVTRDVSSEQYVTISKVIPLTNCLISQIATSQLTSSICIKTRESLQHKIQRYFNSVENNMLIAVSTILDPRFKHLHFIDSDACAKTLKYIQRIILEQYGNLNVASDDNVGEYDFWKLHSQLAHEDKISNGFEDELTMYINNPVTPLNSNPLKTWEDLKEIFPKLYRLFRCHAMIVASSVPAERLFSKVGVTATQEINRLKPNRLNELLFLSSRPENEWF